jgi:hypothetical protein
MSGHAIGLRGERAGRGFPLARRRRRGVEVPLRRTRPLVPAALTNRPARSRLCCLASRSPSSPSLTPTAADQSARALLGSTQGRDADLVPPQFDDRGSPQLVE